MHLNIYTALIIAIVGALVYLLTAPRNIAKLSEIGRLVFACAFLVFVFAVIGGAKLNLP